MPPAARPVSDSSASMTRLQLPVAPKDCSDYCLAIKRERHQLFCDDEGSSPGDFGSAGQELEEAET